MKESTKSLKNCQVEQSGCTIHFYHRDDTKEDEYFESESEDELYIIHRKVEVDGDITGWDPQYSCTNIPVQVIIMQLYIKYITYTFGCFSNVYTFTL